MTKTWIALAVAAAALAPAFQAQAQDKGDWIVRAHALYLKPHNTDNTGLDLSIDSKTFPEFDISYFLTPNLALELVLTYPQKQKVYSGDTQIGTFKHLPPTLSFQYHFTSLPGFRPYLGAGLNYTRLSNVEFNPAVTAALQPTLSKNSYGLALGGGVDVPLGGGWLFNADLKKVQVKTDVSSFGSKVGTLKVDPVLFGVGIGKRF